MLYISINIGTYSIKFLDFKIEKKKITYQTSKEVVIDSDEYNVMEDNIVLDLQLNIVSQYLEEKEEEYKVILNAPNDIITERFLEVPVKNKKKASLMIPFQLEEDIPYSLADCHIASSLETHNNSTSALVNICKESVFVEFFNKMKEYKIAPKLLTSEVSAIQKFIQNTKEILPQSFCILDIGHSTTNAYFFANKELKSTHTSYIAGFSINEVVSQTYSISIEEAAIYKHQNCFFLSADQYEEVNEPQKVFAQLMASTFEPLIREFKRWHIGFRVQNGLAVSDVFVIGGSSNIKNIGIYLSEQFDLKVSPFDIYNDTNNDKIDNDEKQRRKFAIANMMAKSDPNKSNVINFLQGKFSIQGHMDLPLHSFSFVATRMATIVMILVFSLFVERIFINRDLNSADKKLRAIVKNPILKLAPRDQRKVKKSPKPVLARLNRESKTIRQEIKTLQASVRTNALKSLEMISQLITGLDLEIIQFQSLSGGDFTIMFKGKDVATITQVDEIFKGSTIKDLYTEKNIAKRTFTITGTEN